MNKIFYILFVVIIFFVFQGKAFAQDALNLEFIKEIFYQPDHEVDFTETIFNISQKAQQDLLKEDVNVKQFRRQLKRMTKELSRLLKGVAEPEKIIEIINAYLFETKEFRVNRSTLFESSIDELLFNKVLENKEGYCLSLSVLYLSLAQSLDLPISGVMVPGHFFVRYQGEDGINIETTKKGYRYDDDYYKRFYLKDFDDGVSLKNLTSKEVIAVYVSNLANHYKLQGYHEKAQEMFKLVMDVIPGRASFYVNLGNAYERDRKIFKAIIQYQQALKLNPYMCEAHYNLGLIHFLYTKQFDEARRYGNVAKKLGCRMHPKFRFFLDQLQ